jgi:hypothetical protein
LSGEIFTIILQCQKSNNVGFSIHVQCQKSKKVGFLDFLFDFVELLDWIDWIFSVQSNPIIQQKSNKNQTKIKQKSNKKSNFLELDLVGCSIIHPKCSEEKQKHPFF